MKTRGVMLATTLVASVTLGVFSPAGAQVVMERRADGSVVITNQKRGAGPARRSAGVSSGVQVLNAPRPSAGMRSRTRSLPELEEWVTRYAGRENLDVNLVLSVISAESSFDPRARSHKGAIGLMQLMPDTARELGIDDPWDPESNIRGGTRYLRQMLDRFGQDLELALAAYNAGPGAVERNGGVPPYRETRNYVQRVLSRYRGGPVRLAGSRIPGRTRPIEVRRDAQGHLVILTP